MEMTTRRAGLPTAHRRAVLLEELAGWLAGGPGWEALAEAARRAGGGGGGSSSARRPGKCAVWFDFEALRGACPSADLFAALEMQPEEGLACLAGACFQVLFARDGPGKPKVAPVRAPAPGGRRGDELGPLSLATAQTCLKWPQFVAW